MAVIINSAEQGNYLIEISQDKYENSYCVGVYEKYDNPIYGEVYTTINENYYPTIQKAKARFNYLKRNYR